MNNLTSAKDRYGAFALSEHSGGGVPQRNQLSQFSASLNTEDRKYRQKCTFLRRMISDLLWENSILFERLQRKLAEANLRNEERRQLVRKLVARVNRSVLNHRRALPPCIVPAAGGRHSVVLPSGASRVLLSPPERSKEIDAFDGGKMRELKDNIPSSRGRKKNNSDKRFVQPIPLDSMGRPIFPIELPGIEIHCLGEIDNKRGGYHSEDLLFPIGYCSSREFAAVTDPLHSCTLYTCTVNDNGPEPKFEVSGDDNPAVVYSGRTPDEAVSSLMTALNAALVKARGCASLPPLPIGKGAQFFGLSIPTIHHLIQGCLGTRKCVRYKPVRYETSRSQQSGSTQPLQQEQVDLHLSFRGFLAKCVSAPANCNSNSKNTTVTPNQSDNLIATERGLSAETNSVTTNGSDTTFEKSLDR